MESLTLARQFLVQRTTNRISRASGNWNLHTAMFLKVSEPADQDYTGGPEFANIGARLSSELPYQPWAAELVKQRTAGIGKDDPVALCKPAGALRLLTYPPYRKLIQMPGLVVILSERDVTVPANLHGWQAAAQRSESIL